MRMTMCILATHPVSHTAALYQWITHI